MPAKLCDRFLLGLSGLLLLLLVPFLLGGERLNHAVFLTLNNWGRYLDPYYWVHLTLLGDGLFALAMLSMALAVITVRDAKDLAADAAGPGESIPPSTAFGPQPPLPGAAVFASAIVAGGLLLSLVIQSLKRVIGAPRPAAVFPAEEINIIGEPLSYHAFPSGHSATAFFIMAVIICFYNTKSWEWLIGLATLAALAALSRIALGAHFPLDVLVGSLIGLLAGWGFMRSRLAVKPGKLWARISVLLIWLASVLLFLHDPQLPQALPFVQVSSIFFTGYASFSVWQMRTYLLGAKPPKG